MTFALWAIEAAVYLAVARAIDLAHQHLGRALPRRADQLRRRAAGRAGLDRHLRRRRRLRRQGARRHPASVAVTYLLLLRFILYVPITIVGLIVLVTRYGGWARLRQATHLETSSV